MSVILTDRYMLEPRKEKVKLYLCCLKPSIQKQEKGHEHFGLAGLMSDVLSWILVSQLLNWFKAFVSSSCYTWKSICAAACNTAAYKCCFPVYGCAHHLKKKNHFTSFNESFEASVIRWLLEVGSNWIFSVNPYKSPMKSNLVFNICEEM